MQTLRLAASALVLAIVLSSVVLSLGFASASRTTGEAPRPTPNDFEPVTGRFPEQTAGDAPGGKTLSSSTPAEDVRGEPVPGVPRHPGSLRVSYSEARTDALSVVRAGYVAKDGPGAVRDFYVRVFRTGGWRLANVEYAGGDWYLLAVRGGSEAVVEVSAAGRESSVEVEVSRPWAQEVGASAGGSNR